MNWFEPLRSDGDWIAFWSDSPQVIRDLAAQFRPHILYRMKSTGQLVAVVSFCENNTLTAYCQKPSDCDENATIFAHLFGRFVFGIHAEDLEPWPDDVPAWIDVDHVAGSIHRYLSQRGEPE